MNWNPFRRKAKTLEDVRHELTEVRKDLEKLALGPIVYRTKDHPEANGRAPLVGEHCYTFHFYTEHGQKISIVMGEKGFQSTSQIVMDMLTEAPSYDMSNPLPAFVKVKSEDLTEHERKMKIVHAVWLNAYIGEKKCDTDLVISRTAKMMGIPEENLFDGFDSDYIDRAWCSRPPDWKPQDSLA